MTSESNVPNRILVHRVELKNALKVLALELKRKTLNLVVFCGANTLYLRVGATECKLDGQGYFDGEAHLPGRVVTTLLASMPEPNPMPFERLPEHLGIGNIRFSCDWRSHAKTKITTTLNSTLLDNLCLEQRYTLEQIQASGMGPVVEAAIKERDQKIAKAYELLKPFGVELEDLSELVKKSILDKCPD